MKSGQARRKINRKKKKKKKKKILTNFRGEYFGIIDLLLDPGHEEVDILWGGDAGGHLELGVSLVLPKVLVLGPGSHFRAGFHRAKVRNSSVNEVNPVEEVNHWGEKTEKMMSDSPKSRAKRVSPTMNSEPLVLVLTGGQRHRGLELGTGSKGGLGLLVKLMAKGA